MVRIKTDVELLLMREAGAVVAEALEMVKEMAKPGCSTELMDREVESLITSRGARPAFKGYKGYPSCICTSINSEVVHGIPSAERVLQSGDLLSVDVGVEKNGYFGDAAVTVAVGKVSRMAERLLDVCRNALMLAIEKMKPGVKLSVISSSIEEYVESEGFSVVREYVGHGIGRSLHEEPQVPNFAFKEGSKSDITLEKGVVLAVEPMISAGKAETKVLGDGWTAVTRDGSLAAHFEHTVAVREDGPWVLTE